MIAAAPSIATVDPGRAAEQMKRWHARSRRVALARKLLPLTIVTILLAMGGWIIGRALLPQSLAQLVITEVMPNPRFWGQDNQARPFLIGALKAMRSAPTDKTVVLSDPFITLGGARMGAQTAAYQQDTGTLTLQGDVIFDDGQGTKLTTDQAVVDTKTGVVRGSQTPGGQGVRGVGPTGEFQAESFEVTDQGKKVVLRKVRGRVKGR